VFSREPAARNPEAPTVDIEGFEAPSPRRATIEAERRINSWNATHVLIQYVPHMFGATRFGNPAVPFLVRRLRGAGLEVTVVAHELFIPWAFRPDLAAGSLAQRAQTAAVVALADRVVVTTEDRYAALRPVARAFHTDIGDGPVPVGSNVEPVQASGTEGHLRLGLFSTLSAEKRFDVVLEAFDVISSRYPGAELVLVGDLGTGGSRREKALLESIRTHPSADRITVSGKLSLAEIAPRIASLDVFLFPMTCGATSRSGTLPLPLGCGVPVVAARGRETPAYFVDGENIAFADALTGSAFAAAVERLVEAPQVRRRIAAGGQQLFRARLAWPSIVDRLFVGRPARP
jgi:glycosyltransferase involved in cell wall biosynthesis